MNKKGLLSISLLLILSLSLTVFQYAKELKSELADAAYSAKPAAGHSWSEMECTQGLCITGTGADQKIGIGTYSPSQKLEVNGSGLFSGDVCNGTGKCLSAAYQTNVIAGGTNPTCPAGQTAIMKANAGIWYTATATQVASSWSQVSCGAVMTADGTPLLMVGNHTQQQCSTAGGTVVPAGGTDYQCRFNASSCPSNWTANNWCTMGTNTCCASHWDSTCKNSGCCTTGPRDWGNSCTLSCTYYAWGWSGMSGCYVGATYSCPSPIVQIGCY